jgi:hypothetical protein
MCGYGRNSKEIENALICILYHVSCISKHENEKEKDGGLEKTPSKFAHWHICTHRPPFIFL